MLLFIYKSSHRRCSVKNGKRRKCWILEPLKLHFPGFWELFLCVIVYIQKQPSEVFCKKGVLKIFTNFIGKHLCWLESLFNKVTGLKACYFIKTRLQHLCFPVKFAKFLRTPILKNISERLLLYLRAKYFYLQLIF